MPSTTSQTSPSSRTRRRSSSHTVLTEARGSRERRRIAFWIGAATATVGAVALGGRRSRTSALVAGAAAGLGVLAARFQLDRLFNDEPRYEVVGRAGELELRHYDPFVAAETAMDGADLEEAQDGGFRRLAEYLGGENADATELTMTSPVIVRGWREYVTGFVMPPGRSRDELPVPNDGRVKLVEVPARRIAVLRFRGRYDAAHVKQQQQRLMEAVAKQGLPAIGEPLFAGFDPPWVLGALRRNEIWIELEPERG